MLLEELFVDSDGLVEAAEVGKNRGQQTSIARIARRPGEQLLDLLESGLRPAASIQQAGVVVARGIEARRELETAFEESQRIDAVLQPGRHLRLHPQRGDICGKALQVSGEAHLGDRQIVRDESSRGLQQPRIVRRGLDVACTRLICASQIAGGIELIGEQTAGARAPLSVFL